MAEPMKSEIINPLPLAFHVISESPNQSQTESVDCIASVITGLMVFSLINIDVNELSAI